ncbi:MAG: helix-turn-helix domain-containing protein [Spirochaetia bacterium]
MAVKLGEIVQNVRKKSGLSQKELADLAGIGKTTVFDIENGKNSVRFINIQKVCTVLNIRFIMKDPFGNESEVEDDG